MEHVELTEQLFGQCKMELNINIFYLTLYAVCKKAYLEKHTSYTQILLEKHTSCKLIIKPLQELLYSKKIVIRNGKKHSDNEVSYNYLGPLTHADHNSIRSQYSHAFFILFSCFSCEKFEKTLVTSNTFVIGNVQKPGIFIFTFLTKEQKDKK